MSKTNSPVPIPKSPENQLVEFINQEAITQASIVLITKDFTEPMVLKTSQWKNNKNQEFFWQLLLQKSADEIISFLTPNISAYHPNVAAWCLNIKNPIGLDLFLKTHKLENNYKQEKFNLLGTVLLGSYAAFDTQELSYYYQEILKICECLIKQDILKLPDLVHLRDTQTEEYLKTLEQKTILQKFIVNSLNQNAFLFNLQSVVNNNVEDLFLFSETPQEPVAQYLHITFENIVENLYTHLEALCLSKSVDKQNTPNIKVSTPKI